LAALMLPLPALAASGDGTSGLDLVGLGKELAALAVIVLVLESALATIFQWRLYRMLFNNRAVKTIVMIAAGLLIVFGFNYDVFNGLLTIINVTPAPAAWSSWISMPLSALIIAGGSAGVNTLFQRLGIRNPVQPEEQRPLLAGDQAWISVRVQLAGGMTIMGPVQISVAEVANNPDSYVLAGTLVQQGFWQRFKAAFTADPMRFPNYGGRLVKTDTTYRIFASGQYRNANNLVGFNKEVYSGRFASRAIVDLEVAIP
jgi:hypothetical protein